MVISNKFEIDIEKEQLFFWKDNIRTECHDKGDGQYNYQKFFQLDQQHKDHWINYAVKYSGSKVWVDFWYKKRIGQEQYINYKKRVEKLVNNVIVEFNYLDEMVKITDMELLPEKSKEKGYKWVNKVKWDMERANK